LKDAMTHTPVLMLPNFQEDFIVETDVFEQGMRVVLMQNSHPICYFSKKFCPKFLSTSTYVRGAACNHCGYQKMVHLPFGQNHDKIFIPDQFPVKQVLLEEFHATPMAGHA